MSDAVKVVCVFPDLLGTYGDSGNAMIVSRRLALRGYQVTMVNVGVRDVVPADGDFYLMGGGEDGPQARAAELLVVDRPIERALERGAGVLAVCAGFQVLGQTFLGPDQKAREGIGIFNAITHRFDGPRSVGELAVESGPLAKAVPLMVGYENHQGVTELVNGAIPLGRVVVGKGNNHGTELVDGAISGRAIGTYMHGPVFARNPALCDFFIASVVGNIAEIPDDELNIAHSRLYKERLASVME